MSIIVQMLEQGSQLALVSQLGALLLVYIT